MISINIYILFFRFVLNSDNKMDYLDTYLPGLCFATSEKVTKCIG